MPDNFKQSDLSQYSQCENLFVSKNQVDETSVNHSIGMNLAAQFQKPSKDNNSVYYSVTTSSQIGGCITNSDNYIVCGTDKTISIVPENGLKIKDVIVDEISVGPVSHYTFWRISENHTIEALFVATEYKIISGKVISTDMGTGLGGYYVYVWNDQYQQLGMSKTDTSPDNIGYYIINELEPSNNLLMEVRPPDVNADYSGIFYNQQNYWSKADNISTLNGNLTDINFSLPRNSKFGFRGIVHDGTNGLNNVIVSIFSENTGFHKYVQTNSLGCYYVTNLEPSDSYIVSTYSKLYDKTFYYNILKNQILGEKPNFSTFLADYARKVYPDYPAISNIDIVTDISSNSIQGCVLSDSLPVSGVWVNAWSPELGNGNGAFTNSNGHYDINGLSDITFDDIPINGYIVEIDSKDYYYQAYNAVDQRDNAILVGSNSNSINFILVKKNSESISGIIEDESGQKIEGIFIKAWSEIEHSGGNAVSNENGFYEIFELEKSNDYIVTAQPHWTTSYQDDQKINISSGSDNVNFSIKQNVPGLYIIEGIITDCFEQNVSGADVEIYSNKRNFTYNVTTNSSGFYKITDIPSSDDYVLKVFPDNNSSNAFYREQDIFINFNAEKNIILGQGKKISGAVYSYNNLPLENVVMTISSEKKGYYCQLLTNRNGSYTANNLPESFDYIITATPEKNSQYSNQKKINRAPQIGINFILSRGGTISGCIKDATTGAFLQGVIVNIYSKTMLGLYGYNTTTISNTDGEYFAHNLLSHDQHGNALDNYVVTAFKEDYPPQAGGGKKVGDTVDFILTKSTMNELSGIVQGYSSGELLNYEVVIKIFTNNGKFLFNDIVDENGHFNVYSLQSNVKYQLKFLAFVDGIEIMNQWAGKNDLGVQRREDAKTYSTASTVNFKFNDKLRSKPRTLNEQYSRVVQNIRKIYSISNNNQSQLSINIRFEWAPCVPKDSDETYYSRFLNQPDFIFSDRNTRRKTPINNLSIDQNFSGDEETYYFCIAAADRNGTPYATKTIDFQVDTIAPYNVKISVAQQQYEQNILLHLNAIGAYDIYLSNDGFGINGQWEKYQLEKNWLLNSDSANSTIYCLFRDNYQNISKQLLEIPYVPVTNEYSLDDVIRILKILSRIETSISYFPDITNEKKLALPDVIFLLQNLSK